MKNLLCNLIVILIFSTSLYADDFSTTTPIICNYNVLITKLTNSSKHENKTVFSYTPFYKYIFVRNISLDTIYIWRTINNQFYDTSISNKSNIVQSGYTSYIKGHLAPDDSVAIDVMYLATFIDSVSKNNGYLKNTMNVFYRKSSSDKIDSFNIDFLLQAIEKPEISFIHITQNFSSYLKLNAYSLPTERRGHYISKFYNTTSDTITVDSVKYNFIGSNFDSLGFRWVDSVSHDTSLPVSLKPFNYLMIDYGYLSKQPESSSAICELYCHKAGSQEKQIYRDTMTCNFLTISDFVISKYSSSQILSGKKGFILKNKKILTLSNWSSDSIRIKSITYDYTGDNLYKLDINFPLPYTVPPYGSINNIDMTYNCDSVGSYVANIYITYENMKGESFSRSLRYYIYVSYPIETDVPIANIQDFEVYPNPAKNLVNLKFPSIMDDDLQLIVTDLNGKNVENIQLVPFAEGFSLITDKLPNGFYLITLKSGNKLITRNLIISK